MNKIKNWFFEKINKISKPLARIANRKEEKGYKLLISEMKERHHYRSCGHEMNNKEYYEQLYA